MPFSKELESRLFEINGKLHLLNKSKTRCYCGLKFDDKSIRLDDIETPLHICDTCNIYLQNSEAIVGVPTSIGNLVNKLEESELKIKELTEENNKLKGKDKWSKKE